MTTKTFRVGVVVQVRGALYVNERGALVANDEPVEAVVVSVPAPAPAPDHGTYMDRAAHLAAIPRVSHDAIAAAKAYAHPGSLTWWRELIEAHAPAHTTADQVIEQIARAIGLKPPSVVEMARALFEGDDEVRIWVGDRADAFHPLQPGESKVCRLVDPARLAAAFETAWNRDEPVRASGVGSRTFWIARARAASEKLAVPRRPGTIDRALPWESR